MSFTKTEESYIEHEVQLRLHSEQFRLNETKFQSLEKSINRLEDRFELSIKHLDNKFMLMFGIILGSIWLPAILHYLHIT